MIRWTWCVVGVVGWGVIERVEMCYRGTTASFEWNAVTKGSRRRVQPGDEVYEKNREIELTTCRLESRKGSDNRSCWLCRMPWVRCSCL